MIHKRSSAKLNLVSLLKLSLPELILQANKIRKKFIGCKIELCSVINAKSGLCSEDCKFCAQSSRYATNISTYPLRSKNQILKAAGAAKVIGATRFGIVTSGNRLTPKEVAIVAEAVREIEHKLGIKVCASLGVLGKHGLKILKAAGLTRYHHNIETSPRFYSRIVSTHSFEERIKTIKAAKETGLEVCSGGIIGMGETWQDRVKMANLLKDLDVDSIPINLLVPIKGTPLEFVKPISASEAIKTISIFRIILKDKIIKIAAGREIVLKDCQSLGFLAGANGMLIGGYLTIKGQHLKDVQGLVQEIKKLWTE